MSAILETIWDGEWGGVADTKHSGIKGSFADSVGIDGHSEPGKIKVHQALAKDSGATVDGFVMYAIACSNGYSFWFSADSGKIWARSVDGVWTLAHTTVPTTGEAKCLGADEYNGYIVWATQTAMHRIPVGDADDNWSAGAITQNWNLFTVGNQNWHPMAQQDLSLFVGDSNLIVKVNSSFATDNAALDINTPHTTKTLIPYDLDLLLGTFISDRVAKAEIVRWDVVDNSWDTSDPVPEAGINAFIQDDNYVFVQAGHQGRIYFYNGEKLEPYKRIPGIYVDGASNTQSVHVHPGSVGTFLGRPVFGVSNKSKNAAKQGVYSLGSYSRDYTKVLSGVEWVISQNKTEDIEIGAILEINQELFVAWKDGANYGVDKIDWSNKYADAYVESRMLFEKQRSEAETLGEVAALYTTLRTGGISFSYRVNHGDWTALGGVNYTSINGVKTTISVPEVGSLQLQMGFDVDGNSAPEVEKWEANLR